MSPLWGPPRVATPLCRNFGLVEPVPGAKPANVVAEYTPLARGVTVVLMTTAETPDDELVRAAQSGSREATELLLIRHQPWVFNLAVRMLLRRTDAEDATQEVLLNAFKALPSFRGDCQFRTWLYRIAVNHILNIKKASVAVCSFEDAARGLARGA